MVPDQTHCFVGPNLGLNCLQEMLVDDKSRQYEVNSCENAVLETQIS